MIQSKILKAFDALIGPVLVRVASLLVPVRRGEKSGINSILIIRPGGIGDAVLLLPVIRALKDKFPCVTIDILAEQRNGAVFFLTSHVRSVFLYNRLMELLKLLNYSYDVVIDTEQWHLLSSVVARLTRAPVLIGFATNERKKLMTHPVDYSHDEYEVDGFFHLFKPLQMHKPAEISIPFLEVPDDAARRGGELLGDLNGRTFIVIFPGASISERRWGAEKFREVTERLHTMAVPIVVVGGKEDTADGDKIIFGLNGLNLAGKTTLAETAAVIEKAAVLVSGDSGILHIGVGLGKPTVSLFGPGIAKKWAPRGDNHIVINKYMSCSPCTKFGYTPKCPINAKCMSDITVDEVMQGIEHLMRKNRNKKSQHGLNQDQ